MADRLLGTEVADVDGNVEDLRGTVSVFIGPNSDIRSFDTESKEIDAVGTWLSDRIEELLAVSYVGLDGETASQRMGLIDHINEELDIIEEVFCTASTVYFLLVCSNNILPELGHTVVGLFIKTEIG